MNHTGKAKWPLMLAAAMLAALPLGAQATTDSLPHATLNAPALIRAYDTILVSAQLGDCSQQNIAHNWHSVMASRGEATMLPSGPQMRIVYSSEGTDTITYIVSNAFGTDTATLVCQVVDCGGVGIPYFEDFSGVSPTLFNEQGHLPLCWESIWDRQSQSFAPHVVGTGFAHFGVDGSRSLTMMAGGDPMTGIDQYADTVAYVLLPPTAEPLNTLTLSLWYAFQQADHGTLSLGYMAGGSFHRLTDLAPASAPVGSFDTIALYAIPDSAERLAFRWVNIGARFSAHLDNIGLFVDGNMQAPLLWVDSLGTHCVRLAWLPVAEGCSYRVTIDNLVDTVVSDTAFTLCGLGPGTTLTARVATLLGADTSRRVVTTFTTHCHIAHLPYFNDFESADALTCWGKTGNISILRQKANNDLVGRLIHSGSHGLRLASNTYPPSANQTVYSPAIEAPAGELLVGFWASTANLDTALTLRVGVLTTPGNASTFTPLGTCILQPFAAPAFFHFDTRGIEASGYVSIAFQFDGYTDITIIDDLSIELLAPCARLRQVESYALSPFSAVVEWEADPSPALPIDGVRITLADLTDTSIADFSVVSYGTNHFFDGLAPGHKYMASIAALCSGDTSEALTTLVVPTAMVCGEVRGNVRYGDGYALECCYWPYHWSQTIYPAAFAASVDTLFGIAYRITTTPGTFHPSSYDDFIYTDGPRLVDVYIGQTDADSLASPVSASDLVLAVQGFELDVADTGWVHINFTNPVPLVDASKLIVTLADNTGSAYGIVTFGYHTDSSSLIFYSQLQYSDTTPQFFNPYTPDSIHYTTSNKIPDIQLLGGCSNHCLQPHARVVEADTHSATLAWQQRGAEEEWQVEYRHEADSSWNVAGITTDTSFTVLGLNASTGYHLRVSSVCDTTLIPSPTLRASTLCSSVSLPYHQSFRLTQSPYSYTTPAVATCWHWNNMQVISVNNGLNKGSISADYVISPQFDANLGLAQVTFEALGYGIHQPYIRVGACDDDGTNLVWVDSIPLGITSTIHTIPFNSTVGSQRHIAIGGSFENWTLFDVQVDHSHVSIPPAQSPTVGISCTGRQLTVTGAEGLPISIFTISGVLLSQSTPTAQATRTIGLQGLPAGVYFVCVGTLPAQKIVLLR